MNICGECANRLGYTPKKKVVGMWTDVCDFCHKRKAVCDSVHDYYQPRNGEAGKKKCTRLNAKSSRVLSLLLKVL